MPVTPTDDEQAIRQVATEFFARRAPVAAAAGVAGDWRPLHAELAGLDFFGADDLGVTPLASGLIAEAAGREVVPGPWLDQLVAVRALAADADLVAPLIAGEQFASVAFGDLRGLRFGADVDRWVLIDGDAAVVLEPGETEAEPSTDPLWRSVAGRGGTEVARVAVDGEAVLAFASGLAAAAAVGGARRVLDDAIAYVKDRTQFGRPIGSFQALKHRAANAEIALLHAHSLVYAALAAGDPHRLHVARVAADGAYRHCAEAALQMHGGVGFTSEVHVHLYLKHAQSLRAWPRPVGADLDRVRADLQLDVAA